MTIPIFLCLYVREVIFRETLLILLIIILSIQASSLWRALTVIPISLILIYSFRRINRISGLLMIIYVIVFIGGLLIFLIRVASLAPQEQTSGLKASLVVIMILFIAPLVVFGKKLAFTSGWITFSLWFWGARVLVLVSLVILLVAFITVTKFFLVYKGFIRTA